MVEVKLGQEEKKSAITYGRGLPLRPWSCANKKGSWGGIVMLLPIIPS